MEIEIRQPKVGDRVRIKQTYHEPKARGLVGKIVQLQNTGEVGIDFGCVIDELTWNMNILPGNTGRYIHWNGIEYLGDEWDE